MSGWWRTKVRAYPSLVCTTVRVIRRLGVIRVEGEGIRTSMHATAKGLVDEFGPGLILSGRMFEL